MAALGTAYITTWVRGILIGIEKEQLRESRHAWVRHSESRAFEGQGPGRTKQEETRARDLGCKVLRGFVNMEAAEMK